jgi:hypothetical protein
MTFLSIGNLYGQRTYGVWFTLCSVRCVCYIRCVVYTVHRAVCVLCTYSISCAMYSVLYACTVCGRRCTACEVSVCVLYAVSRTVSYLSLRYTFIYTYVACWKMA